MGRCVIALLALLLLAGCGPDTNATATAATQANWERESNNFIDSYFALVDVCTVAMTESIYVDHSQTNRTVRRSVAWLADHDFLRLHRIHLNKRHAWESRLSRINRLIQSDARKGVLDRQHPSVYCRDLARPTPTP